MQLRTVKHWVMATIVAFAVGNGVVAAHAWRFTHFAAAGLKTANPEDLGLVDRAWVLATGVVVPRPEVRRSPAEVGLEATLTHGEVSTWVIEGAGRGTALMFHGYGGAKSDLLDEAAVLHRAGWTTILVDFPGSGDSAGNVTSLGWQEAEVVVELAARTGPVLLFGKSMGAAAILRAVGDLGAAADVLVIENPYDRLVTTAAHRFEALGLPGHPGAELLVAWGGIELGFNGFAMNPVEFASRVSVPTLVLHGSEDARVRLDEVRTIDAALAGPHALEVFEGAGHVGLYAADPARWERVVTAFVERHSPRE